MKKIISILLAIIMIVASIPLMSFATEEKPEFTYADENGSETTLPENSYNYVTKDTKELTGGWWVVYENVNTTDLTCSGDVKLLVLDGFTLKANGSSYHAGINVTDENCLTIYGQEKQTGCIEARGGAFASGIGGDNEQIGENITINGCTVNAYGGAFGAGIGGGDDSYSDEIVINNGTVNAYGGACACGIGNGDGNSYESGTIRINGGRVNAYSGSSCYDEYGIGGNGTDIIINGGFVYATGANYGSLSAAGIYSQNGSISVDASSVLSISTDKNEWTALENGNDIKDDEYENKNRYVKVIPKNHECEYKYSYTAEPTCTENGKVVYVCECGETKTEVIKTTGHHIFINYVYNNDETCTKNGTETAKCIYCDATDTREVADTAFGHVEGNKVIEDVKPATCTEDGSRDIVVYCTCCGAELSRTARVISALGHCTEIINQKEATEDEDGYTGDVYCKNCNQILEYGEVIEKLEKKTEETTEDTVIEETTGTAEATTDTTEETTENTSGKNSSTNIFEMILNFFRKIINYIKNMFK